MTSPKRGQFLATTLGNMPLCREHYLLVLSVPQFPPTSPGQFIQIACRDVSDSNCEAPERDWMPGADSSPSCTELRGPVPLLRRPFSLAGRRDHAGHVELDIIHRAIGAGTGWLAQLQPGDPVDILGPLGNSFELPNEVEAILIGGGVGIPPMLYLAEQLAGRRGVAFCGATSRDLLPLHLNAAAAPSDDAQPQPIVEEFARHGISSVVSTDDGSFGFHGYVTQALERYLDEEQRHNAVVYTCGPEPMMKRVAEICTNRGLECQVAVERAMACGMGTCQSCVIRVRKQRLGAVGAEEQWAYKLACTDGPIFRAAELLW